MKYITVILEGARAFFKRAGMFNIIGLFTPLLMFVVLVQTEAIAFSFVLLGLCLVWQLDKLLSVFLSTIEGIMLDELTLLNEIYQEKFEDVCEDIYRHNPEVLERHGIKRNTEDDVSVLNKRDESKSERH